MVVKNMAQNFRVNNEKIHSNRCPSTVLNAVPSNCTQITFADLKIGESYKDKAIIGKIGQLNPIGKRANGYIRKLLITDALSKDQENQKQLTVFLLDQYARDSNAAELEGYIIIANFLLEKSTLNKNNELPLQVLVKTEECQVLFGRKCSSSESKSSNNKKSTKKKDLSCDENAVDEQGLQKKKKENDESH
ncbi:telo_bind domain-containing protein, partial [Caerostris darwini]